MRRQHHIYFFTAVPVLCGCFLILFILAGCKPSTSNADKKNVATVTPLDVSIEMISKDLVPVNYGAIDKKVNFTGTIDAITSTTVQSQSNATVLTVAANVGDYVKKGQVLVRLNNQDSLARLDQATASLRAAQAQAALAKDLLTRYQRLYDQGFVPLVELEKRKTEYKAQQENVNAQQATVRMANKASQDTTIIAPITGYITARRVDAGQSVGMGQTIFQIVDNSAVEVKATVSVNEQQYLQVGQPVIFKLQGDPTELSARISRISPVADMQSRSLVFFAKPQQPMPSRSIGAFVEGYISAPTGTEGQVIPLIALHTDQTQPYVWVIRNQRIVQAKVAVLQQDRSRNQATVEGLEPTDLVSLVKFNPDQENKTVVIKSNAA